MKGFRFIHTVEIVIEYEAETLEHARAMASMDARDSAVMDLIHSAADLCVLDPRKEEE